MIWIAGELEFDPNWLMACMAFETGERFTANVKNPASSATGLIQFMRTTALNLGTTTADLARMTAEDQLNFVYKYFRPYKGRIRNLGDCYMAILWPRAVGKADSDPIFVRGDSNYGVNSGLDTNRDYQVTRAEAAAKVTEKLAKGMTREYFG